MNFIRTLTTVIIAISLSACVNVEEPQHNEKQLVVSSSFERDIELDEHSTYAFTPLQESDIGHRYPLMTETIEQYMTAKSFTQVSAQQNPTFYIGYLLETEDDLSDEQLVESFGLNPGLPTLPHLEKGTLMVFVLDGQTKQFVWKAAAQGFVIEDLSDEERRLRMQQIVVATFNQFVHKE
ncbi:DUF4136 domain-containing protein [Colwelliaceae bacterium BS250]